LPTNLTIREVTAEILDLPIRRLHQFSTTTIRHQSYVLVRVRTEEGLTGIGEGVTPGGPWWGGESVETIKLMIDAYLAPMLVGEDASRAAHLLARMDRAVAGNRFAKAPLEVACYDLLGKALGVPVCDLLGGLYRDSLPSVWALASGDPRTDVAEAEEKIGANLHSRFKLKAGAEEPAADVERIVKISKALGEEAGLVVDPNGAWDELTARLLMPRLEEASVALLEQPVPRWNLEGMARLTAMRSIPIMADESVCSAQDALAVVRNHSADMIAIKLPKSGGITGARKVAAVAEAAGVPLYGGSTLETSVGTAASLHVYCSVPRMTEGCELFGPLWLADDIVEEPVEFRDCRVWLPRGPGLGVRLDEEKVAYYRRSP
jgi:muconate cycloisomerase